MAVARSGPGMAGPLSPIGGIAGPASRSAGQSGPTEDSRRMRDGVSAETPVSRAVRFGGTCPSRIVLFVVWVTSRTRRQGREGDDDLRHDPAVPGRAPDEYGRAATGRRADRHDGRPGVAAMAAGYPAGPGAARRPG